MNSEITSADHQNFFDQLLIMHSKLADHERGGPSELPSADYG
jgi:hypothetical protein